MHSILQTKITQLAKNHRRKIYTPQNGFFYNVSYSGIATTRFVTVILNRISRLHLRGDCSQFWGDFSQLFLLSNFEEADWNYRNLLKTHLISLNRSGKIQKWNQKIKFPLNFHLLLLLDSCLILHETFLIQKRIYYSLENRNKISNSCQKITKHWQCYYLMYIKQLKCSWN